MSNKIISTISKRVAIIILIAVFVIEGIIACKKASDITSSESSYTQTDTPSGGGTDEPSDNGSDDFSDNNGDSGENWNLEQTKGLTFYGSSYRGIHVPGLSPSPWVKVSYNDTDRLDRLWKAMIDGWKRDGKRRLYIKTWDGDFYFDENYDIRWSKKPYTVLKYFKGGVIVNLLTGKGQSGKLPDNGNDYDARGGEGWDGFGYLGGLYMFAMDHHAAAKFNSDTINWFFGVDSKAYNSNWNLFKGRMEVLVLHRNITVNGETGKYFPYANWPSTGYGLQVYMDDYNSGYADGNNHLYNIKGNTPERYMPTLAEHGAHNLYKAGFRWMYNKTYSPNRYYTLDKDELVSPDYRLDVSPSQTGPVGR